MVLNRVLDGLGQTHQRQVGSQRQCSVDTVPRDVNYSVAGAVRGTNCLRNS